MGLEDEMRLGRGPSLITRDGTIPIKKIGKGAFATVYRETVPPWRVFAITPDDIADKELLGEAHIEGNPHIPPVERFGQTARETVYTMPFYASPLRASETQAWKDYQKTRKCHERERRKLKFADWGYRLNVETVECAKAEGVSPLVADALDSLVSTAANYGSDYVLELTPRNLATDEQHNLVLLDPMFDRKALERKRNAKRTSPRAGQRGYAGVEPIALTTVAVAGVLAAPRLNTAITARPLGAYVPPSAGASVLLLVGGGLARRGGYRKTGNASIALGIGMGVGTLLSSKAEGGMLAAAK